MITAISQNKESVTISYIKDSKQELLEVPKNNFWYWQYDKKDVSDDFKSYDSKDVSKHYYKSNGRSKVSKFSIWEYINTIDDPQLKKDIYTLEFPKILLCDIETEVIDGFPNPDVAKEAVTTISFAYIDTKGRIICLSSGYKERFAHEQMNTMQKYIDNYYHNVDVNRDVIFKYKCVKDETELLKLFIEMCSNFNILSGWYFEDFDWPYLKTRMNNLGINYNRISPTKVLDSDGDPEHFVIIDYMGVFKKYDRTVAIKESMTLEFISTEVLGVGKLKYNSSLQEMYEQDYTKYVLYNAIDTINVLLIHDRCKTLNSLLALSNMSATEVKKCQSPVAITEGLFSKVYLERNMVIPKVYSEQDESEYEGAFVRDPILGMHEAIACYDFSSLYPSIARQLNLSPESYIKKLTYDVAGKHGKDGSYTKYKELSNKIDRTDKSKIIGVTGCMFDKTPSVLKQIFDDMYKNRKTQQARYKTCDLIAHKLREQLKSKNK